MGKATHNCTAFIRTGEIPKRDADISGTGVIIAFVLSAYITILTVILAYIFGLRKKPCSIPSIEDFSLSVHTDQNIHGLMKVFAEPYSRLETNK
jgi:hypothetical protein